MEEPEIHNDGPVQGQNIAQNQYITQHIHNAGGDVTLSAKLAQAWRFPHQRDFFSDEPISDYEYAIQLDLAAIRAQTGKGDVLTKLKRYKEAISAYEYAISTYEHAIQLHPHLQSPLETDPVGKSCPASQTDRILFQKTYRIILISLVYIVSLLLFSIVIILFNFYAFSHFFMENPTIWYLCTYNAISFVLFAVLITVYVKATKLAFDRIASILK
jgi:tetratricopeptide (TPR) repeat protein